MKTNVQKLERKGQNIREYQNGTFSDDSVNIGKLISDKDKMYVAQLPRWLACDKFEREIGRLFANELMMTMRRTAMITALYYANTLIGFFFVNFSRHETHDNSHIGISTRTLSRTCYFLFDLFYLVCFRFIRNYFARGGHFRNSTKAIIRNLP